MLAGGRKAEEVGGAGGGFGQEQGGGIPQETPKTLTLVGSLLPLSHRGSVSEMERKPSMRTKGEKAELVEAGRVSELPRCSFRDTRPHFLSSSLSAPPPGRP